MSITLQEIAKKVGCSKTTVSFVLNGKKKFNISEELSAKISRTAKKYNYRKSGKSGNIAAMILPRKMALESSPYYTGMLLGFSDVLSQNGCVHICLHPDSGDSKNIDWLRKNPALKNIRGAVLGGPMNDNVLSFLDDESIPYISLGFKLAGQVAVKSEIFTGTMSAFEYLKKNNYKSIGFIGDINAHPDYLSRYQAFLAGSNYFGVCYDEKWRIESSVDIRQSYLITKAYLKKNLNNLPDVFCCATEAEAAGTMEAMKEFGVKIPKQTGILAYGYSSYPYPFNPSLSLIEIDNEQEGRIAGKAISDLIFNKNIIEDAIYSAPAKFRKGDSC